MAFLDYFVVDRLDYPCSLNDADSVDVLTTKGWGLQASNVNIRPRVSQPRFWCALFVLPLEFFRFLFISRDARGMMTLQVRLNESGFKTFYRMIDYCRIMRLRTVTAMQASFSLASQPIGLRIRHISLIVEKFSATCYDSSSDSFFDPLHIMGYSVNVWCHTHKGNLLTYFLRPFQQVDKPCIGRVCSATTSRLAETIYAT